MLCAVFPKPTYILRNASRIQVRFEGQAVPHSTSGYRFWRGNVISSEPLVALVLIANADCLSWTRSSHRGSDTPEMQIMYAPMDHEGLSIQVALSILDATAYGSAIVESIQTHPMPGLEPAFTGSLSHLALSLPHAS